MISTNNNKLDIKISRTLKPKHLRMLSKLDRRARECYLLSLAGLTNLAFDVPRDRVNSWKTDRLAEKSPLSVLRAFNARFNANKQWEPLDTDHGYWIGVEIECFIPYTLCEAEYDEDGEILQSENALGIVQSALEKARIPYCTVKHDGSLSDDDGTGIEVTILFNNKYGFGPLEKLCRELKALEAYVNTTCGLHVHLDHRGAGRLGALKTGKTLGRYLPVLAHMMPESRRSNHYCKLGVSKMTRGACRYYAVNLDAYRKFNTVEIRLHSGTTDFNKISNWISLLNHLKSSPSGKPVHTFQEFLDKTRLPDQLVSYVESRIQKNSPSFLNVTPITIPEIEVTTEEIRNINLSLSQATIGALALAVEELPYV